MLDRPQSLIPAIQSAASPVYVDVVLPRRLRRPFTYLIPTELKGKVEVGQSVIVPFGSQDLHGLVIAVYPLLPCGAPDHGLKAIRSLADASPGQLLTPSQIKLSQWVADRYAAPWGQCIKLVLPPGGQAGRVATLFAYRAGTDLPLILRKIGEVEMQLLKRLARRPKGITEVTLTQIDKGHVMPALRGLLHRGLSFGRMRL